MSTMPSAVRLFSPDHPAIPQTARRRLEEKRRELIEQMAEGYATTFDGYMLRVGEIKGLKIALDIVADIEKELTEDRGR